MSDQALCDRFTGIMADFTAYMAKHLPDDVVAKLKELRSQQNTELANIIYDTMFANQEAAARRNVPSCQDTGVIQYFIQCGSKFPLLGDLPKCLPEAAWCMKVKEFGPLIVTIDTTGDNLFKRNKKLFNERKEPIVEEILPKTAYTD